jgi:hypothetical protein
MKTGLIDLEIVGGHGLRFETTANHRVNPPVRPVTVRARPSRGLRRPLDGESTKKAPFWLSNIPGARGDEAREHENEFGDPVRGDARILRM